MTDAAGLIALATRICAGEIKALSIKQPWPHRIFNEGKDVENRDWPTRGRGWVIVHAGKAKDECETLEHRYQLPFGGVVGMMRITDCVRQMDSQWFNGPYGFVIGEAFPLPLVPCRGQLGFFMLPDEVLVEVADRLMQRADEMGVKS